MKTNLDVVKQRLMEYVETKHIKKNEFYKKSSTSQSNFSGSGANSAMSTDKIRQILLEYPDINPDWLLLGTGNMLRNKEIVADNAPSQDDLVMKIISAKDTRIEQLVSELSAVRSQAVRQQEEIDNLNRRLAEQKEKAPSASKKTKKVFA